MEHTPIKPKGSWKLRAAGLMSVATGASLALVQVASAGTINDSIGPILTSLPTLFTSLVGLIVAAIPIVIVLSIASFIVGFLTGVLKNI